MENDSISKNGDLQVHIDLPAENPSTDLQGGSNDDSCSAGNSETAAISSRQLISIIQKNVGQAAQNELLAIFKSLNLLKEDLRNPHHIDALQQIQCSASAIMNLIQNAMVFSLQKPHGITLAPEVWSMRAELSCLFSQHSFRARQKGLSLKINIPDELPDSYLTDPTRINQIMTNLIDNAIKYSDSGQISLNVEQLSKDHEETRIRFTVTDSGRGLNARQIDSIFNECPPACSGSEEKSVSAGIGLLITRMLVKKMRGFIGVKSSPGIGSEFWVVLPLKNFHPGTPKADEQTIIAGKAAADAAQPSEKMSAPRVLVVDDVEINRKVVGVLLKGLGIISEYASNGRIALEMACKKEYDLILMDCIMPEMDGFAAAEAIREFESGRQHRALIVALTSHDLEGTRSRCMKAGMDDCLYKPIQTEALRKILQSLPAKNPPVE